MYTFSVKWWINGVKVETYVNIDRDMIAEIALEELDAQLAALVDDAIPIVDTV